MPKISLRHCKKCEHKTLQLKRRLFEYRGHWDGIDIIRHDVWYCPQCGTNWEPKKIVTVEDKEFKE